ncbi:MAG: M56 family metallopeptidase [Clostridia bacterium]|nr:M56 family metallopeptidase [Clostridia bacterium]
MRKAVLFNFLLEATIIASIAIVLMLIIRKVLRKQLGSRAIAFAWMLVAIRLLCPLTLPNPAINEIRSPFASDQGIRPIAGQVQVRFSDFVSDLDRLKYRYDWDREHPIAQTTAALENAVYDGYFAKAAMWVYLAGAAGVAGWFLLRNIHFRHMLKAGRVEAISGKVEMEYHQLCVKRKCKALPVYYTDPLPSACLVGVVQPYIALPLTSKPNETIHVLDHEICHYKGWDHLWGLVRLLCCIVHWFNPLVWLAANLSMTDCELACDERVTRGLDEQQRKDYASVLVLAAARRNAPGLPVLATGMTMTGKKLRERVRNIVQNKQVLRWLAIIFAVIACLLLVMAFATSEYKPVYRLSIGGYGDADILSAKPIQTEEEAIDRAKELWSSPYLSIDESNLQWNAVKELGGFRVEAMKNDTALETILLTDGTPVMLDNLWDTADREYQPAEEGTYRWDEAGAFILNYMDTVMPGHSQRVEAILESDYFLLDGIPHARLYGMVGTKLGVEVGYSFVVRLDESPRVVTCIIHQPVHAQLWKEGIAYEASPLAHRMNGLLARAYTEADHMSNISQPPADALSAEDAMKIAVDYITEKYGETPEAMQRFEVLYVYHGNNGSFTAPYWQFDFSCLHPLDMYSVMVHSPDGEIIYACGRDEGNG